MPSRPDAPAGGRAWIESPYDAVINYGEDHIGGFDM